MDLGWSRPFIFFSSGALESKFFFAFRFFERLRFSFSKISVITWEACQHPGRCEVCIFSHPTPQSSRSNVAQYYSNSHCLYSSIYSRYIRHTSSEISTWTTTSKKYIRETRFYSKVYRAFQSSWCPYPYWPLFSLLWLLLVALSDRCGEIACNIAHFQTPQF